MRSQPFLSPFVSAPGVVLTGDLEAISLPAGHARGIVIDNPSGSWLTVFPLYDFVPPYTIGWARDFPMSIASATVRYTDGPSGQISTQQGDPMSIALDTDPVGSSDGSPAPGATFIEQFTPVLAFADLDRVVFAATGGTGSVILVSGITGKRHRLLTLTPTLQFGTATTQSASNVWFRMSDFSGRPSLRCLLTPHAPFAIFTFPLGLDFPIGLSIAYDAITNYADQRISVVGSYQVI